MTTHPSTLNPHHAWQYIQFYNNFAQVVFEFEQNQHMDWEREKLVLYNRYWYYTLALSSFRMTRAGRELVSNRMAFWYCRTMFDHQNERKSQRNPIFFTTNMTRALLYATLCWMFSCNYLLSYYNISTIWKTYHRVDLSKKKMYSNLSFVICHIQLTFVSIST